MLHRAAAPAVGSKRWAFGASSGCTNPSALSSMSPPPGWIPGARQFWSLITTSPGRGTASGDQPTTWRSGAKCNWGGGAMLHVAAKCDREAAPKPIQGCQPVRCWSWCCRRISSARHLLLAPRHRESVAGEALWDRLDSRMFYLGG